MRRTQLAWLALVLSGLCTSPSQAQPEAPRPVPAPWQALGVAAWPAPSPQLGLDFADIVLPGKVSVHLYSKLQFTQKLVLFAYTPGVPESMQQLASFSLSNKTGADLRVPLDMSQTQVLVLLAQTPSGWQMVERELKVGHKP